MSDPHEIFARYRDSAHAVFLETLGGRVVDCNQAALDLYGYTRSEMLRLTVFDLVPIEIAHRIPDIIVAQLQAGTFSTVAKGVRKNGEVFDTEVSTEVIGEREEKFILAQVTDLSTVVSES